MNVHELCYLICVILMFIFDLKHKDIDLSALKHFSGLKRSPFTADLVHKQLTVLT